MVKIVETRKHSNKMKVIGVCAYPIEHACTRYRFLQFVEPLKKYGIELEVRPFLNSAEFSAFYQNKNILRRGKILIKPFLRRFADLKKIWDGDLTIVQREAMLFGPSLFEWLYRVIGNKPLILDLDDAIYLPYLSPKYGKIGTFLKFFGKTDNLIKHSEMVICGGKYLAEHVEELGTKSQVIPTVVDTDKFVPLEKNNDPLVIGWIGTGSTFPFLERLMPVLQRLAKDYNFLLRIRGSERNKIEVSGLTIENLPWSLEDEIKDFQSFDIGLYPLEIDESRDGFTSEWVKGKSGFKAIQYLSLGLPFVMSPIGVCKDLGIPGKTHFLARNNDEWEECLKNLLSDAELRKKMGRNGREHALNEYTLEKQTEKLANIIKSFAK